MATHQNGPPDTGKPTTQIEEGVQRQDEAVPRATPRSRRRAPGEGTLFWHQTRRRWVAVADLGSKRGKRVRISYSHRKKTVAAQWLRETLSKRRQGVDLQRERWTVARYLAEWLAAVAKQRTPNTYRAYKTHVDHRLLPHLGTHKLGQLSVGDLEDYTSALQEEGVSALTIRKSITVLGTALAYATRKGWLRENVARRADVPREEMAAIAQALTPPEVEVLCRAAQEDPLGNLYIFMVGTGVRIAEALGTRWRDIDWERASFLAQGQLAWNEEQHFELRPLKNKKTRLIALGAVVRAALQRQQVQQQAERVQAGATWQEPLADLVFTTPDGRPWHRAAVNRRFHTLLTKAGLKSVRLHDLRHTHSALMQNHGVDERIAAAILGHEGKSITSRIYGHPDWPSIQRAAQIVNDLLEGAEER